MKEEISKKIHDIYSSLNVVRGFIEHLDKDTLSQNGLQLYDACQLSLDKIEKNLDEIRSVVRNEANFRLP